MRLIPHFMMLLIAAGAASWLPQAAVADGKIMKWVDEKGVTHYGDKIPTQDITRKNSELNKQGVTVKQNDPGQKTVNPEDPLTQAQLRKDKALLASYNSAEEIDLARDRSLQLDELSLSSLIQRHETVQKKLEQNTKLSESFKTRKKPAPLELAQDINDNKNEIKRIDEQINQRKQVMQETRARFDADKKRYVELKATNDAQ